jgi:pimeloyl-ACP methyl ester carboxylesterase
MRKSVTTAIVIIASTLVIAAAGCYTPGGPVPEEKQAPAARAWTMQDVEAAVSMQMESIYSPVPRDNGVPPEECDYIHFLRFRPKGASGNAADADAILVLMPGFMGGANSLEYVGRQLVYLALTQDSKYMEVWVMDRRPNNLEDLAGLNAAEGAKDTQVAIDYYYNGAEIDGHTFAGFLGDEDMPFLSEFGLELAMEDVYKVITTMVPDPAMRRSKVFVGGHSLGGPLTAYFAGWDFDGDPATLDDAGYMNCAGLVGLDTSLVPTLPTEDLSLSMFFGLPDIADAEDYAQAVEGIQDGTYPRRVPLPLMFPEFLALQEPLAMEAAWHPDEESVLLSKIPKSAEVDMVLRMLHSRAPDQFLLPIPYMTDFRYTNEAQFGIMVDDNYQPVVALQASCGFLSGGAVVVKEFPLPQDLANIPGLSDMLGSLISIKGQYIANDAGPSYFNLRQGPLYSWANFDEIGNSADPDYKDTGGSLTYTTMEDEVSDIQDVARFMYNGPTNAMEWYFALRVNLDMEVAATAFGPACGLLYLHGDAVKDVPQIAFVAEDGPFIPPDTTQTLKGYNHLDVCVAAADRPSRRENEVIRPTIDFILENLGD